MRKILIIDDSISLRQYLRLLLINNGYAVLEAENGEKGYKIYSQELPDFVITDILMPDMDGIELITKLRNEFKEIKIIVMSDGGIFSGIPYFEICRKIGVTSTLEKPINKDLLLEMLCNM